MELPQLFFERYDPLCNFWLAGMWDMLSPEQMIQRPHARVNSIAWTFWHMLRVEDAGVSRFIADLPQVLDEGGWMARMDVPLRDNGSDMTLDEVDELSRRISIDGLHGYALAVQARTRAVVSGLRMRDLDALMEEARLRQILVDEGLARGEPAGLLRNYLGWSKGKVLFNFAITHPYQHLGEISTLATLLGVVFD